MDRQRHVDGRHKQAELVLELSEEVSCLLFCLLFPGGLVVDNRQ